MVGGVLWWAHCSVWWWVVCGDGACWWLCVLQSWWCVVDAWWLVYGGGWCVLVANVCVCYVVVDCE